MKIDEVVDGTVSRRRVLALTGAGSLAMVGSTGLAAAKSNGKGKGGGGRGFITTTATVLLDGPFTITGPVSVPSWNPTGISPSCNGNAPPQDHVPYMTDAGRWIFFPADRNVNTGVEYEVVHSEQPCRDVPDSSGRQWIKVVTKPA